MSPLVRIPLRAGSMSSVLGDLIRDTRTTVGWSQDQLADRAFTSQTKIHRMETNKRGALDFDTLERVLSELGLRLVLEIEGIHVIARREQRDAVHAAVVGQLSRRLRRAGWAVAVEVQTGGGAPTGWIDIIAFRPADGALLVIEVKTALPDVGALLRQVGFYEREAPWAARRMGWLPASVAVAVVCLDSGEVRETLARNRHLLSAELSGDPGRLIAWVGQPGSAAPSHRTLVGIDMRRVRGIGLIPTVLSGRRSAPAYRDYAEAAAALRAGR